VGNDSSDQQYVVLWSLNNAAGDELRCETQHTSSGLRLRFRSSAGVVRLTGPIQPSSVDSWMRIWRAYYLTSGWSDPGEARRGHRRRARPTRSPAVMGPILRYWTMSGPGGATVACELVRTPVGLEVRCDTSPVRAQAVSTVAEGLPLAQEWKSALMARS
jgi:hypothetical protein